MIIFCGCSYLSGYGIDYKNSAANIISEYTNDTVLNLSKPGGSNYCINKQVEYAIQMKPDVIIFSTTEVLRFDYILPNTTIDKEPSILDFSYNSHAREFLNRKGKILSESFRTLDAYVSGNGLNKYVVEKYRNIDKEYLKMVHRYFSHTDFNLKQDQDKKMIESSMYLLDKNKIKWILIDGNDFFESCDNIIKQKWKDLVDLDPQSDMLHFGNTGNKVLADLIKEKL